MQESDNAPAFVAALAERGLQFARVHDDDERPQNEAEDAREERLTSMKANGVWLMQTEASTSSPRSSARKPSAALTITSTGRNHATRPERLSLLRSMLPIRSGRTRSAWTKRRNAPRHSNLPTMD